MIIANMAFLLVYFVFVITFWFDSEGVELLPGGVYARFLYSLVVPAVLLYGFWLLFTGFIGLVGVITAASMGASI